MYPGGICTDPHNIFSDHTFIYADRAVLSEQHTTCFVVRFNKHSSDNRDMESRCDQYSCSWYNNLYLYPGFRPVRHDDNNGYHNRSSEHPDLYTDRAALPEQHTTCFAVRFNKHSSDNRDMESRCDQYSCSWYNNLYLYAQ